MGAQPCLGPGLLPTWPPSLWGCPCSGQADVAAAKLLGQAGPPQPRWLSLLGAPRPGWCGGGCKKPNPEAEVAPGLGGQVHAARRGLGDEAASRGSTRGRARERTASKRFLWTPGALHVVKACPKEFRRPDPTDGGEGRLRSVRPQAPTVRLEGQREAGALPPPRAPRPAGGSGWGVCRAVWSPRRNMSWQFWECGPGQLRGGLCVCHQPANPPKAGPARSPAQGTARGVRARAPGPPRQPQRGRLTHVLAGEVDSPGVMWAKPGPDPGPDGCSLASQEWLGHPPPDAIL